MDSAAFPERDDITYEEVTGLQFGSPQFAWALILPAGIVVLYLLRRKYVPRQVPSTFLWQRAMKDHAANRPIQRLRRNLLLPVQFLAALVLALSLMQPCVEGGAASRTILIFDLSGSMQAVTDGRSRLSLAKERAEEILRGLPAGEEITVLASGEEVRQILSGSTEKEDARQALQGLACGRGGADLDRAVSLAEAIRREDEEKGARILVFSDSYLPPEGVSAVNVGRGEENRSVYSLTAEEDHAYVRIGNYGGDCVLTVTCSADGVLCEAKEVEIPAGETAGILFRIPQEASRTEVRIREQDALEADNQAEAAVKHSRTRTVALSQDSLFLESALRVRGDLRVLRLDEEAMETTEADLYIYGTSPLIFSRDPSETVFTWAEEDTEADGVLTAEDTPMTAGLTLKNVFLRSCRPVTGGRAAIRAGGEVVAAFTDSEAAIGFSLKDTNLPLKYDFPILVQNILAMLLPEAENSSAQALPDAVPMTPEESDVRTVAPERQAAEEKAGSTRGRDLTRVLLAAFLGLLVLEFILAREPWTRKRRREAANR